MSAFLRMLRCVGKLDEARDAADVAFAATLAIHRLSVVERCTDWARYEPEFARGGHAHHNRSESLLAMIECCPLNATRVLATDMRRDLCQFFPVLNALVGRGVVQVPNAFMSAVRHHMVYALEWRDPSRVIECLTAWGLDHQFSRELLQSGTLHDDVLAWVYRHRSFLFWSWFTSARGVRICRHHARYLLSRDITDPAFEEMTFDSYMGNVHDFERGMALWRLFDVCTEDTICRLYPRWLTKARDTMYIKEDLATMMFDMIEQKWPRALRLALGDALLIWDGQRHNFYRFLLRETLHKGDPLCVEALFDGRGVEHVSFTEVLHPEFVLKDGDVRDPETTSTNFSAFLVLARHVDMDALRRVADGFDRSVVREVYTSAISKAKSATTRVHMARWTVAMLQNRMRSRVC